MFTFLNSVIFLLIKYTTDGACTMMIDDNSELQD